MGFSQGIDTVLNKTEPRNAEMSSSRTAFSQNTSEKRKGKNGGKIGQNTHEVKKNADFNQARQNMRKVFSGDTFLQQQTDCWSLLSNLKMAFSDLR